MKTNQLFSSIVELSKTDQNNLLHRLTEHLHLRIIPVPQKERIKCHECVHYELVCLPNRNEEDGARWSFMQIISDEEWDKIQAKKNKSGQ